MLDLQPRQKIDIPMQSPGSLRIRQAADHDRDAHLPARTPTRYADDATVRRSLSYQSCREAQRPSWREASRIVDRRSLPGPDRSGWRLVAGIPSKGADPRRPQRGATYSMPC